MRYLKLTLWSGQNVWVNFFYVRAFRSHEDGIQAGTYLFMEGQSLREHVTETVGEIEERLK
jgi:hypothetical protein